MKYKGVGIHVFAGGFTGGVKEVMNVDTHLETHGFGLESAKNVWGVEPINCDWRDWPDVPGDFSFGNPRCTGFSTITSGYDGDTHGAWSKQTCDIHEFCNYSVNRYPIMIWESVQQAYSVGRELLDYLRDTLFVPNGYRIAHIMLNAASFGNAQQRKRYFFVAYKGDKNFNIVPPDIDQYYSVLWDAISHLRHREAKQQTDRDEYDADTHVKLTKNEWHCVPKLPNGWNLNVLARYDYDSLPEGFKFKWKFRTSDMPFSMHCIHRVNWFRPSPTLHSSCARFIHPSHNRPLTIGELAAIMGWGDKIPQGRNPIPQLAKGIVPAAGRWLAEQVQLYLDDEWGDEDWESTYNLKNHMWEGGDTHGAIEKTFNLTNYVGQCFNVNRYPDTVEVQDHLFNIDPETGKPIRPWKEVARRSDTRRLGDGDKHVVYS